jgi:hypothetical protein
MEELIISGIHTFLASDACAADGDSIKDCDIMLESNAGNPVTF